MGIDKVLKKALASSPSPAGKKLDASTPSRSTKEVPVAATALITPANDKKRNRNLQASPSFSASPQSERKPQRPCVTLTGNGTHQHPFRASLRSSPNKDDCMHCNEDHCCCTFFSQQLERVYHTLAVKRVVEIAGKRDLCAKSILPPFVSRLCQISKIKPDETFYDFGCGNGSVLFQVAYMTGARCVGVELSPHNAEVARQAWAAIKPVLEKKAGRPMPQVEIVTGDLGQFIANDDVIAERCVIWTANLLMPKALTHYMSERFRKLPVGTRILCFDDLYPHSRSVATIRDPEAFEKFEMVDYVWQEMSVEWTACEGKFYLYRRKSVSKPASDAAITSVDEN